MNPAKNYQQFLRIIRYFLPRLSRASLTEDIERERAAAQTRCEETCREAETRASSRKKEEIDILIRNRDGKKSKAGIAIFGVMLGVVTAFVLNNGFRRELAGMAGVFAGVALAYLLMQIIGVSSLTREIQGRLNEIDEQLKRALSEARLNTDKLLHELSANLDQLILLYEQSLATDSEVSTFIDERLEEVRQQVNPALGFHDEDIQDRKAAEAWAPTFFQTEKLPSIVVKDQRQSAEELREYGDEILAPLRSGLPVQLWPSFRMRILRLWGLSGDTNIAAFNALEAVKFSSSQRKFLAGHYFFQRVVCTDYCLGLFRAYVNVLNSRIPRTHSLQILYSDVTAIGVETASRLERYDLSGMTVNQHTHSLTLELNSGTTYNMSVDAGSLAEYRVATPTTGESRPASTAGIQSVNSNFSGAADEQKATPDELRYAPPPNYATAVSKSLTTNPSLEQSNPNENFRKQIENVRLLIRDAKFRLAAAGRGAGFP